MLQSMGSQRAGHNCGGTDLNRDNQRVFILRFVHVLYHTDWFVDIEKSFYPWDKLHLIMVYFVSMYCWIQFASVLLKVFASMFISDIGL